MAPALYVVLEGLADNAAVLRVVKSVLELSDERVWLQLRQRCATRAQNRECARKLAPFVAKTNMHLLWNAPLDDVLAVDGLGIHLPDGATPWASIKQQHPALIVGASTHSQQRAQKAHAAGVDVVVLGPVWPTPSKQQYGAPLGTGVLANSHALAIGGVTPTRVGEALAAGAMGVAVNRAICHADDVTSACRQFLRALDHHQVAHAHRPAT